MLLLCDFDGTVVDPDAAFRDWVTVLAERHGQDVSFIDWLLEKDRLGARRRWELYPLLRERLGLSESAEEFAEAFMHDYASQFRCLEGVFAALADVRREGHRIAIVTNGSPWQELKGRAAGVSEIVDSFCVSSIEGVWKPDAKLLQIAAERAGCPLDGAWMIGDRSADVEAAAAAGIRSIKLPCADDRESECVPTQLANSFPEAVAIVLDTWRIEGPRSVPQTPR